MFNWFGSIWFRRVGHLSDDDLLFHVDGELPARQSARIAKHLRSCWDCRARLHRAEEAVTGFASLRRELLDRPEAAPPAGWRAFDRRLEGLAGRAPRPSRPVMLLRQMAPFRGALATAGALALVCFAVFVRFSNPIPAVSAQEVLDRMDQSETRTLRQVAHPVVRQVLRIRRSQARAGVEETVTEVWSDSFARRFGHRGDRDALWREFGAVLEANHLAGMPPVAGRTFAAWRSSVRVESERVLQHPATAGSAELRVSATASGPFHDRQIVEGEITVRAGDWSAVSQTWRVQAGDAEQRYTVDQIDYQVLPQAALDPVLFAALPKTAGPAGLQPIPPPPPPAPPAPDTDDLEMEIREVLHQRGDCLTGAVQVIRPAPGSLLVRGVVDDEAARRQLIGALPRSRAIETDIRTPDDVVAGAPAEAPPYQEIPPSPAGEIPGAELLRRKHYDAGGITKLVNDAFRLSSHARRDAWELRRLAERYGPHQIDRLRESARKKLERMLAEHVLHLRAAVSDGRSLLAPVLAAVPASLPPRPEPDSWNGELLSLVEAVEQMDGLVQDLFTRSGSPSSEVDTKIQQLGSVFASLEDSFQTITRHLALSIAPGVQP
jgi:anti-sigma factor RsiW